MFVRVIALLVLCAAVVSACGGSEEDGLKQTDENTTVQPVSQSYTEGSLRMEIEYLDTGLLKGHAYAEAENGWRVVSIGVAAVDHKGSRWIVIEPSGEQVGFGSPNANEFFEVRLEELPRGKQLSIKETVIFENEGGSRVEHAVEDRWPP